MDAREAGLILKRVESLYYRELPLVVQPGVESGYVSGDGMTTVACGEMMCVVESTLYDEFIDEVMVSGSVLFQPNEVTVYNQLHVQFEFPILVGGNGEGSGSGAFSARVVASIALIVATGMLALVL